MLSVAQIQGCCANSVVQSTDTLSPVVTNTNVLLRETHISRHESKGYFYNSLSTFETIRRAKVMGYVNSL